MDGSEPPTARTPAGGRIANRVLHGAVHLLVGPVVRFQLTTYPEPERDRCSLCKTSIRFDQLESTLGEYLDDLHTITSAS